MTTCKHGETEAHGEIGKDWCAGPPRSWYFEALRGQLEEQMNLDTEMFTRFADKAETADGTTLWDREVVVPHYAIPGEQTARMSSYAIPTTTDVDEAMRHGVGLWQIHSPTSAEFIRSYERSTAEKFAAMRERYAPAWGSVFDTLENFTPMGWFSSWGEQWYADPRAPLQYREWGAEVSFDGEHWTNVLTVGTPIYDTLVVERGDPTEL